MNYITEIKAFYDWLAGNPLPASAIALWHALMSIANGANWNKSISPPMSTLQSRSGLGKDAVIDARNKLKQVGLIDWRKRGGNQSAIYVINSLVSEKPTQNPTQSPTQEAAQNPTQSPTQEATIYKLNETKLEEVVVLQKNPPIPYEKIRSEYNRICISFPKCTKLSQKRKEAIAARIHSGYSVDEFTQLFETAQESDFLKGKNKNNWRADFDWLICDSNMAKTIDGRYANREVVASEPTPDDERFRLIPDD